MAKFCIIFAFCVLGACLVNGEISKEEWTKQAVQYRDDCMKEVGASQSDYDELSNKKPLTTRPAKCLAACILKKYKVMGDNGKFCKSAALEYAKMMHDNDEAKMKKAAEVLEICDDSYLPSDHCEGANTFIECINRHSVQ